VCRLSVQVAIAGTSNTCSIRSEHYGSVALHALHGTAMGTPPIAATSTEPEEDIRVIKMDIEPLGVPPEILEGK
jgi:hypothetical protein